MERERCVVPGCRNISSDYPKLNMFHLPVSKQRLQLWLKKISNPVLENKTIATLHKYKICESHFINSSFQTPLKLKLNRNAVPILNLPGSSFGKIANNSEADYFEDGLKMSYLERIPHTKNPVAKKLLMIMSDKHTNLCIAVDLTSSVKILNLAEQLGPYLCIFKIHIDIVEDFTPNFTKELRNIAETYKFLIMEDRKFADISQTVSLQFSKGIYKISSWADLVTAYSFHDQGVIKALSECEGIERGIFLLAEIKNGEDFVNSDYLNKTMKTAKEFALSVAGIVCQNSKLVDSPGFIQLTSGEQLNASADNFGLRNNCLENSILETGADIIIVGRDITLAEHPMTVAETYRKTLWESYLKRLKY